MLQFKRRTMMSQNQNQFQQIEIIEFLSKINWFQEIIKELQNLNPNIQYLKEISENIQMVEFKKGQTIHKQNDDYCNFNIVQEGEVLIGYLRCQKRDKKRKSFNHKTNFNIQDIDKQIKQDYHPDLNYTDLEDPDLFFNFFYEEKQLILQKVKAHQHFRDLNQYNYKKRINTCLALTNVKLLFLPYTFFQKFLAKYFQEKCLPKLNLFHQQLFNCLDINIIPPYLELFKKISFQLNQYIFQQGDIYDGIYLIIQGNIEVIQEQDNISYRLGYLQIGQYFGVEKNFQQKRSQSFIVKSAKAQVYFIEKYNLEFIYAHHPKFKIDIFQKYQQLINYQQQQIQNQIEQKIQNDLMFKNYQIKDRNNIFDRDAKIQDRLIFVKKNFTGTFYNLEDQIKRSQKFIDDMKLQNLKKTINSKAERFIQNIQSQAQNVLSKNKDVEVQRIFDDEQQQKKITEYEIKNFENIKIEIIAHYQIQKFQSRNLIKSLISQIRIIELE